MPARRPNSLHPALMLRHNLYEMQMNDRQVIVIGSGPTGAMAAHELVRNGIHVTMLESGCAMQGGFLVRLMGRNFFRRVPPMEHGAHHIASGDPKTDWYVNFAPG